jgi:hypothetical protein
MLCGMEITQTIVITDTATWTTVGRVEVTPDELAARKKHLQALLSDRYALLTVPA